MFSSFNLKCNHETHKDFRKKRKLTVIILEGINIEKLMSVTLVLVLFDLHSLFGEVGQLYYSK